MDLDAFHELATSLEDVRRTTKEGGAIEDALTSAWRQARQA